jgi:hypothetical protein
MLDQPVVVRLNARELELAVFDASERLARQSRHCRIEHRIIHACSVHRFQTFGWRIGRRRDFVPTARLLVAIGHKGAGFTRGAAEQSFSVDYPALASVRCALEARRALS